MSDAPSPRTRFETFLDELTDSAVVEPDVVGLVAMGSTAERDRVDEWSDHDFALVTTTGAQEHFRTSRDWLPGSSDIALWVREHHDGIKVLYDDGRVLEFGVADLAELARWRANAYAVLYDAGGVAEVMADIADTSPPSAADDGARDVRLVLTELLIGVGRARRGELLSAGDIIRSGAVGHLLSAVSMRIPATLEARLDNLDPRRRFETAYPAIAARIEVALTRPPEDCARALLACVEDVLAPGWPDFPHPGVAAVRARLGWD
ncbi:MAG TPA: hypothetical protein VFC48_04025 [Cellulomonas sp.]|nr:hypothetical protein [Cellulomonas sp.]